MSLQRTTEFSDFQIHFNQFTSRLIESLEVFNKLKSEQNGAEDFVFCVGIIT